MLDKVLRTFCAVLLAAALAPSVAFAELSEEVAVGPDVVSGEGFVFDSEDASVPDNSSADGVSPEVGSQEALEPQEVSDESAEVALREGLEAGRDPVAEESEGVEEQPQVANSWRFVDGQLVSSEDGATTYGSTKSRSVVTTPDGYRVFDSFDQFSNGYYTGTDAAKGIDVSEHQGYIDWAQVKASGVDFVIIRCGYGNNYSNQDDKQWIANVRGCVDNDIPFGVYLYSYAQNVSMAQSEADHVLRLLSEAGLSPSMVELPVYLDMEDSSTLGSDFSSIAQTFCSQIQSAGYKAGVYASQSWWESYLVGPVFDSCYKWVAAWNASVGLTYGGFSDFRNSNGIWQFSDYGRVSGISGAVDLNYAYIDAFVRHPAEPGTRTVADGTYVISSALAPSMALDVAAGSVADGANVQLYAKNGTKAQAFTVTYDGAGFYDVVCVASGKALDVESGGWHNGANVQQYAPNGTDAQKWRVDLNADGTCTFVSKGGGRALDVDSGGTSNGTNVQIYDSNGTAAQRFTLESAAVEPGTRTVADGTYVISSALAPSMALDVAAGSVADGANVQLYAKNGTKAQAFTVTYDGAGFYDVVCVASGKALDVESGGWHNGANVQQYAPNGTDAQKWRVDLNADGTCTFVSKGGGRALDVDSGGTSNGTNVQIYDSNGTAAQRFTLESI